jgi:hypothetical protein
MLVLIPHHAKAGLYWSHYICTGNLRVSYSAHMLLLYQIHTILCNSLCFGTSPLPQSLLLLLLLMMLATAATVVV